MPLIGISARQTITGAGACRIERSCSAVKLSIRSGSSRIASAPRISSSIE
ncbi:hypothetical protein [Victivallis vadensis]